MIGKVLGGRYEILSRLGGGGMAVVYRAKDHLLGRVVAVKVLREQDDQDDDFVSRFHCEARAVASLSHPNVVNIYDVGQDGDIHYIVMECVHGETLKGYIQRRGPLPPDEAVAIGVQILSALAHAHENGIVHRDIKPQNILIGKHGEVKVTDFGIARAKTANTITHTGSMIGSVHYLSPEQARGGVADEKSDLYSFGVVLYEMLTGQVPFTGDSPISVALKHLQAEFVPPRRLRPEIPQSLENVVRRALAKNPRHRYASAEAMLEDLKTALSPERQNEPVWEPPIDEEDLEETKVLPTVGGVVEAVPTRSADAPGGSGEGADEADGAARAEAAKGPNRRQRAVRVLGWTLAIFIGLVFGLLGFNYAMGLLIVPDVTVPRVEGMHVNLAKKKLEEAGLSADVVPRSSNEVERDVVIRQEPSAGMVVKKGRTVTLYVSQGPEKVEMPDVRGLTRSQAEQLLSAFLSRTVDEEYSDEVPPGHVIRQEPAPGDRVVPQETRVRLVVSKGRETIAMPSLAGLTLAEAEATLQKHNLKLGSVREERSYWPKGTVFRQYPYNAGDNVQPGASVDVWVSGGLKDDAVEVVEEVLVLPEGGKADVTVQVQDARGVPLTVVSRTVSRPETVEVPLILAPHADGVIQVYQNGRLVNRQTVRYRDVIESDKT